MTLDETQTVTNKTYRATRFHYARNARAVTHVLGESWKWDDGGPNPPDPTNYLVSYIREFRYGETG